MKVNSLQRGIVMVVLFFNLGGWVHAQSNLVIYRDSLGADWEDWSWSGTVSRVNTSPVHSGTYSISAQLNPHGAVSLYHDSMTWTQYHAIEFYIRGGTNTNPNVVAYAQSGEKLFAYLPITNYVEDHSVSTSVWKRAWIPIADFGITSSEVNRINWKNESTNYLSPFYLDDIRLVNTNTPVGDTNVVNDFSITSRWSEADGGLAIEFSGQTCAYYQVWMATSLVEGVWSEVGMALGTEAPQVWTNNSTANTTFVKFSGLLQKDSWDADADGLLDVYELTHLPLNPLSPFSDADGMPDGWELENILSPTNATGNDGDSGDPDGDGRSNLIEYSGGMNPQYVERNELPLFLDYGTGPWYHDGNGGGWIDFSTSYVLSNQYAMRVALPSNNALAILRVVGSNYLDTTGFTNLEFWINGGPTNGQKPYLGVRLEENTWPGGVPLSDYVTVQSNTWSQVRIPLTHIGAGGVSNLAWIFFKNTGSVAVSEFWMDNVKLVKPWPATAPTIVIDATRAASPALTKRMFGINVAAWDAIMTNADTLARLREGGFKMLRYPGGSLADYYDWQNNRNKTNVGEVYSINTSNFLVLADAAGAEKNITVNYGRGSATEASNWVKHVFGTLNRTVEWWCVGNECFADWEHDTNTPAHNAITYVSQWCRYRTAMTNARPGIKIGVVGTYDEGDYTNSHSSVTNPVDGTVHRGWSAVMLTHLARSNQVPDFYELHYYGYAEGTSLLIPPERGSDYHLLRSGEYERRAIDRCRKMLCDYLGPTNGSNVAIHVTENNCAAYDPGKQYLSLINGMFVPEMFGQAALAGADAFMWWDLHNKPYTNYNNSTTLYGWRNYGDFGMLAVGDSVPLGDSVNEPYPPFYGFKLLTNFARPGDHLVEVTNSYPDALHTYACVPPDTGSVRLLVINTSPDTGLRPAISLQGFSAGSSAMAFGYGITNDLNREDITVAPVTVNPTNIQYTFPKYSMTVLRF